MTGNEANESWFETSVEQPAPKKRKKPLVVLGVVAAVVVAAGAGFWVWHEQPSFCNSICHMPMDPYNATYNQDYNTEGLDKWGNEVENTRGMLAVSHRMTGAECMKCHVPTLSEQISEGVAWITGSYDVVDNPAYDLVLHEASLVDLTAARGADPDSFCLNEACHTNSDGSSMSRDDLASATGDIERNPHGAQHGQSACSDCHKAHRASVLSCTQCHADMEVPEGWISYSQSKQLAATA